MKAQRTITISLPAEMGKEMEAVAREEHRTISELLRETFRSYQAKKLLQKLATQGQKYAKRKGLTPKDFGGPFAN
jgi:metal-responsive CopG/Arc/MetJ family transcriptional regulator